jgi:hypothetical protein
MSIAIEPSTRVDSGTRLRYLVSDSTVAVWRNLMQIVRVPTVMDVLRRAWTKATAELPFSRVFASNISNLLGGISYVEFLMPGISRAERHLPGYHPASEDSAAHRFRFS